MRRALLHPELVAGARRIAPMAVGYVPFGLTLGAAIGTHPEPAAAWLGTLVVYGGSAHLAVVQLTAASTALPVVIATGLLVHARLVAYSLSIAPHWRGASLRMRVLAAATLIDPTWAVGSERYAGPGTMGDKHRYHAGAVIALTAGWVTSVTLGALIGPALGHAGSLSMAAPLCLVAMLVPRAADRPAAAAILAGGLAAAAAAPLPNGSGMHVAIGTGTLAGSVAERARSGRSG